jgi:hypothetical protein
VAVEHSTTAIHFEEEDYMKYHNAILVSLALALICTYFNVLSAQDSENLDDLFRREAPKKWDDYLERARHLQGTIDTTINNLSSKRFTKQTHREFKQRDCCALILGQATKDSNEPGNLPGTLVALNSLYRFELRRSSPEAPWTVVQMEPNINKTKTRELSAEGVKIWSGYPVTFSGISVGLADISARLDQGVAVKKVLPKMVEGKRLAKVELSYQPQESLQKNKPSVAGWILYDPDQYWVIREAELELDWPVGGGVQALAKCTYEYDTLEDGFPVLKRLVKRERKPKVHIEYESIDEFNWTRAEAPESEFTLSAYGFPEPVFEQRSRWYLWIALLGIICMILAILCRWIVRRYK